MSMCVYPIMIFGVSTNDVDIKKEYWMPRIPDNMPKSEWPAYEDFSEFAELVEDGCVSYETAEDANYIGIFPHYEWNMPAKPFKSKEEAAAHIAKVLAPYCNNTEEEIAKACHVIEDTYCG